MYSVAPAWRLSNPLIYHIRFYLFSKGRLDLPPLLLKQSFQLKSCVNTGPHLPYADTIVFFCCSGTSVGGASSVWGHYT